MAVKKIEPVLAGLSGVRFDSGAQSVAKYASAISELSLAQQKVALSASGLNETQVESVLSMNRAAIAAEGLSVKEASVAAGMSQKELAMKLGIQTTDNLTSSTLLAAVAEGKLTQEQYESIVAINASTGAMQAQGAVATSMSTKFSALGASIKSTFASFLTTPAGIITLVSVTLPLVIKFFDKIIVTAEEANEAMDKSFSEFEEATSKVESLNSELETTRDRIRELEAKDSLTFVEQSELEKLRETNKLLQIQADLAEKDRIREAKDAADDTVTAYRKNFSHDITAGAVQDNISYSNSTGNNAILVSDETDISAMLAYIEQMKKLRDEVDTTSEDYLHYQGLIDDTTDSIWAQTTVLQGYAANLKAIPYNELTADQQTALEEINDAIELVYKNLDPAKWRDIQFNGLTGNVKDELNRMSSEGEMTADQVERLSKRFPELNTVMEQTGMDAQDVAGYFNALAAAQENGGTSAEGYTAKLSNLSETISGMKSAYDLLGTAQEEMNTAGGLSADTISKIASSCDNYMDYLYEENGLIKLNTEAWKENANAKLTSDMEAIQREIASIEEQNRLLQEQMGGIDRDTAHGQADYDSIASQIRENTARIQELNGQARVLEGTLNAVSDAASGTATSFSSMFDSASTLESNFKALSNAVAELRDNGNVSASTLNSLAQAMGNLDGFENVINALASTGATVGEAQAACNAFASELVNTSGILDQVNESNAGLIASLLESIGVMNSTELVQERLNASKYEGVAANASFSDSSDKGAEALLREAGASETTIAALQRLKQEQYNAALAANDLISASTSTISALLAQAQAAGVASSSIAALSKAMQLKEAAESGGLGMTGSEYHELLDSYAKQAQADVSKIGEITLPNITLPYIGGSSGGGGSGRSSSGGSGSSSAEAKTLIGDISDVESNVNSLSNALKELRNSGTVTASSLESLEKSMGKFGSFQRVANAMTSSGASMEEAQAACNALATEMIETSGILDQVTDENAEMVEGLLRGIGVTNAAQVVRRKYNTTELQAKVAAAGLADAEWSQVEAFLASTNATQGEIEALQALRAEQYNAALAATDFATANADVTAELVKQAKAAGAGADKIEALTKIQKLQAMGKAQAEAQGYLEGAASFEEALKVLANRAKIEIGDINVAVPDVNVNVEVSGGEDKKSDAEEPSATSEPGHDLKMYGTLKAYEAATHRFAEATEKFRQATEKIGEIEAAIEMTDDPMERFEKRFELVSGLEESIEANNASIKERQDFIEQTVQQLAEAGIQASYDRENNSLILPTQDDGKQFDEAFDSISMEKLALDRMLNSSDFSVTKSGFREIDNTVSALSGVLREQKTIIDQLNETYGKNYTVNDFRQTQQYQRIDGSYGAISQAELDAKEVYRQSVEALNAGNIERYKELSALYSALSELVGKIEGIGTKPITVDGMTSSGTGVSYTGYNIWDALEDPNVYLTTVGPTNGTGSPLFEDNLNEMMGHESDYQDRYKTMAEEAEDAFNEVTQSREKNLDLQKQINQAMGDSLDDLAEYVQKSSDALGTIQNVEETLRQGAKEFAEYDGYLSLDTYKKIIDLGPECMQYLMDENNQWVINEERIQAATKAKAEQLAIDNAMAYVKRIDLALNKKSNESLDELLYATSKTSDATWELVYANLAMLDLNGEQYEAALHNIQVMRDLAYGAVGGIGVISDEATDSMDSMREGLDDILHYVMEMLKQKVQDQIDALEDMKDAYDELIEAKKKSLDATKTEESYEKKRAKKLKEIAKLQARIDMLSLDSSREAQAERTKLLEEMADLQEDLSDTQSDYAIDNQKDALDKMKDAYDDEKDAEIKKLEDSISSTQKVYEMAIDYIQSYWSSNWDDLKTELLQWNYDVGSDLEKNLVSAWDAATAAAQKYGDFVSAMDAVNSVTDGGLLGDNGASGNAVANQSSEKARQKILQMKQNSLDYLSASGGQQTALSEENQRIAQEVSQLMGGTPVTMSNGYWMANGSRLYDFTADELLAAMKKNSAAWSGASGDRRKELENANAYIASMINDRLSKDSIYLDSSGVWWLQKAKKKLYEVGSLASYHTGGTVGKTITLRDDEVLAKLQTGETVLTRKMWENAKEWADHMTMMTNAFSGMEPRNDWMNWSIMRDLENIRPSTVTNVTNDTRPVEITFGDTIINGAAPDAVEKHRQISREMMNEIARRIRKP